MAVDGVQFNMESQSLSLRDALIKKTSEIIWADDVIYIYKVRKWVAYIPFHIGMRP